jgi:hypothetical protein
MKIQAEKHCLCFIKKYPDQWHSFAQDKNTTTVIKNLEIKQLLTVDWKTQRFMFDSKNN